MRNFKIMLFTGLIFLINIPLFSQDWEQVYESGDASAGTSIFPTDDNTFLFFDLNKTQDISIALYNGMGRLIKKEG